MKKLISIFGICIIILTQNVIAINNELIDDIKKISDSNF